MSTAVNKLSLMEGASAKAKRGFATYTHRTLTMAMLPLYARPMKLNKRLQDAYGGSTKQATPMTPAATTTGARAATPPANTKQSTEGSDSGFVKTGIEPAQMLKLIAGNLDGEKPSMREIAGFLMLMGAEKASKILALLPDDLVEAISLEISKIKVLKPEESKRIIARFHAASLQEQQQLRGGRQFAQDLLERSVGKKKALDIMARRAHTPQIDQLGFLNDLEAGQLKQLLRDEPPRLIGIILSHLESKRAAGLLKDLDDSTKAAVIRSMGSRVELSQEVLHSIAKALKGKIRRIGTQQSEFIDGPQILAEIIRNLGASQERSLMEELGFDAPDIEAQIKERLFTIDQVLHIRQEDLQKILADLRDEEIALLMKGKTEEIRARLLRNISSQRGISVSEIYHYMGPVPRKDVDESTRDFVIKLRHLVETGEIVISRDDDIMVE